MTSIFSSATQIQMFPSQTQPGNKRKVPDEANPLLNAAKKPKKQANANATGKRKLMNAEEQPGGLLIVRTQSGTNDTSLPSRPPSSHPQRPPHPPAGSQPSKPPPSKKFRASSQPPAQPHLSAAPLPSSRPIPTSAHDPSAPYDDLEIENDVRAMDDEANHLRRNSRAPTTIDPSFPSSRTSPEIQFQPRSTPRSTSRAHSRSRENIIDAFVPLPSDETPQIQRNKLLREGAMQAIANDRGRQMASSNGASSRGAGHRRRSSLSRGKRISTSFAETGVITLPHSSVSENSFYKHIDYELPDAERVRQLLIWCSARAATPSSSPVFDNLPQLSAKAASLLKGVQEDTIRLLAERKIDLSLYSSDSDQNGQETEGVVVENQQNVTNRGWEVIYTQHIQEATKEDEEWKKVGFAYEAYSKKVKSELAKRKSTRHDEASTGPSEKARGKQRAVDDFGWDLHEPLLSEATRRGVELARSRLGFQTAGDDRLVGGSSSRPSHEERHAEVERQAADVEFKIDHLYSLVNTIRTCTNVTEQALDQRFDALSLYLDAHSNPRSPNYDSSISGAGTYILSKYVKKEESGSTLGANIPDPQELLRALARVDRDRPPSMVGDAARRAAREVQRVGESRMGPVGERRLTGLPPPSASTGMTPRKLPGTPRKTTGPPGTPGRRSGTPARDRDR